MALEVAILYRGPLAGCNYRCTYCPFAAQVVAPDVVAEDQRALQRFTDWGAESSHRISVFFTPTGEVLNRPWYWDAVQRLSRMANVVRVVAQTNLSGALDWLERCARAKIALWCTYHPSQVDQDQFLAQCARLDELGMRYSVGCVGIIEDISQIESLRTRLSPEVYVWVNAYKHQAGYYSTGHVRRLEEIDPLFRLNTRRYSTLGRPCRAGQSVISVSGDGTIRRCHFIPAPLGNIYESDLSAVLRMRPCTAESCHCHIGYVHLDELGLQNVFGGGMLERIPAQPLWRDPRTRQQASQFVQSVLRREEGPDAGSIIAAGYPG
ncbi:MAG: STM4011 family radical SAM protein [Phycisphaerae bacterium]|nr:STM4011 family radical SAM protein [Phycisphaerae bacterium]